jgi:hypothetical protein
LFNKKKLNEVAGLAISAKLRVPKQKGELKRA